jgi:hypothetical protein
VPVRVRIAPRLHVSAVAIALSAVIGACTSDVAPPPDEAPWDEPVAGAAAVTGWRDDGQPTAPFGPGAFPWSSPQEIVAAMTQALGSGDVRATGRVVARNDSGTVIGWVRLVMPDGPVLAADLRIEMRDDGGSWVVANIRSREHCAGALEVGACR